MKLLLICAQNKRSILFTVFGVLVVTIITLAIIFLTRKHGNNDEDQYPSPDDIYGLFPKKFRFGTATSAFQVEGGWNKDGKGPSIWDTATQNFPEIIADRSNGNIAANSYEFYEDDIAALKELEVDFYRFSISWPRILPDGDLSSLNEKGLQYYDNLINDLIAKGIEPIVTMFHFDLPQALQNLGGWTNPIVVEYFEIYARVLFSRYGDRIKMWLTLNEPSNYCSMGYGDGTFAPLIVSRGIGEYLCMHYSLLANARAYRLYKKEFNHNNGKVAIVLNIRYFFPKDPKNLEHVRAANTTMEFSGGWQMHPIFSKTGDYPPILREIIDRNSKNEGFKTSRLPVFTDEEIALVKGSSDFLALNYYTARYAEPVHNGSTYPIPSLQNDRNILDSMNDTWPIENSSWLRCVPEGLTMLLRWIKNKYNNPEILITENGWPDYGELYDKGRINYLTRHLQAVLDAIWEDGVRIVGYTYWSLIDNFEWISGYTEKFGLYQVDFNSTDKTRTARQSAKVYTSIIKSRQIYY